MKGISLLLALILYSNICYSRSFKFKERSINGYNLLGLSHAAKRAAPDSPTGGYAPGTVDCPSDRPVIRAAGGLSDSEKSWLLLRRNKTITPMTSFLTRANISGFDVAAYMSKIANNPSTLPNIGIAVSGGGYRAMLNGAGFVAAADSRTENSTNTAGLGGLLQSTTYLSGLSGGAWLVGSIYSNNFSSVVSLRDGSPGSSVWQLDNSILEGPESSGLTISNVANYYSDLIDEVNSKANAGFEITITDYWGRALSFQLVNDTNGGPAYTYSSIALDQSFISGETPFPIIVADSRAPGATIIFLNSTIYEFNPFELGSWDDTGYGFAPIRYIGSNFSNGVVPPKLSCVRGFDQIGFVMGTSSTLFNQFLLQINSTSIPDSFKNAIYSVLQRVGSNEVDIASYEPNPFFGNSASNFDPSNQLTLVDGGEDGQNVPLAPLIQSFRAVDIIFAVDSSADTKSYWPNGTSLVATYERSRQKAASGGSVFPAIPDQSTFINLGLNNRPTFFGCNASNLSAEAPLIVYVPNAPYSFNSNYSTFQLEYNDTERNLIINNGYDVATRGNGTVDSEWIACVACAVLSRSFTKTGTEVPLTCTNCFNRYCWNGTVNSTLPISYDPVSNLTSGAAFIEKSRILALLIFLLAMLTAF